MPAKVINLFAGPGSGKSTTAAALFAKMKAKGLKVELVTEYAKELVYEDRPLTNQFTISAEQYQRLERLRDKVDYIITDSPLLLGIIYAQGIFRSRCFTETLTRLFNSFDNFNVILRRTKPYVAYGRVQSEHEARSLDAVIRDLFPALGYTVQLEVDGDEKAADAILTALQI